MKTCGKRKTRYHCESSEIIMTSQKYIDMGLRERRRMKLKLKL